MNETERPEIPEIDRKRIEDKIIRGTKAVFPKDPRDCLTFVEFGGKFYSSFVNIVPDPLDHVIDVKPQLLERANTAAQILKKLDSITRRIPVLADPASILNLDGISSTLFTDGDNSQLRLIKKGPSFKLFPIPPRKK